MKKTSLTALSFALIFISMFSVGAEELRAASFTSFWNDYEISVPDGWKVLSDSEGKHYTNICIISPDRSHVLSTRWYTRYATHRKVDGQLEMFGGADDFVSQFSGWYRPKQLIEPAHEIDVAGRKTKRWVTRLPRLENIRDTEIKDIILERRGHLGGILIGDDQVRHGGRQVWTVLPAPSGFYVLAYFAPEESSSRYDGLYEQMVASFVLLKDGPGGVNLPGVAPRTGTAPPAETPEGKLRQYVSILKSRSGQDKERACKEEFNVRVACRMFATESLRKEIIEFVSTMKQPPAIPNEAQRYFIQANTFLKSAKSAADYNLSIEKYKEALFEAPWWGDAYYNLGMALNSAGRPDLGKQALELYILTKPKDAAQAQAKIYEFEAQIELRDKREAEMKAKYGGGGNGFGFEALFRYGAIVKNMSFDASGNERTISLKIVTRKESGLLQNYFQIADITSRNDTFLQKFSMDWRGTRTFFLDDRTYPNKEQMTLAVTSYGDGDANISVRPANNASASIQTTLTALLKERASQAIYAGETMNIGGRDFHILGQGGPKGSLLFFPAEIKGLLENGSARDLMPALVANVNYRGPDGSNMRYNNSDLGIVNGTHYHLEFIDGYFAPKVGVGENH